MIASSATDLAIRPISKFTSRPTPLRPRNRWFSLTLRTSPIRLGHQSAGTATCSLCEEKMDSRQPTVFNPEESIWDQFSGLKRLRRRFWATFYRFPDTGWFGLTPLRTHILICGYGRSGTTLLLMMMEYALPKARWFGREKAAWRAATFEWRNHAVVISKVPTDVCRLHRIRNFYKNRKAKLKTIIMIRDPRDVLSSKHPDTGDLKYFQETDQWKQIHTAVMRYRNDPEVFLLRYEELVTDPDAVQARIDAFTGEKSERRYADAHKVERPDFDAPPLMGVRPVEKSGIGRWSKPEHRQRIEEILKLVPELPQILIDLGYEPDTSWLQRWRQNVTAESQPAMA